jgi:tRNA A-37 threonylcarbamoyl transferase component Bud32
MTECPPAENLLEFASGRLSDDSQASVEAHIDSCSSCRGALSSLAKADSSPNKSFGRYELETVIGQGGMGIVYKAWDPELARAVAIKVVRQTHADAALRTRLVQEARSLARLSHPNVCHVYDVGTEGEEVWVAMELIEGTTLRGWAQTARPHEELFEVLLGAAEGIAAAHASGLIHRDIKPENVLVTRENRPIVTDFGLARIDLPVDANASTLSGNPLLTATGAIVGTPAYLAPEQLTGDTIDARVDQFAWATMAWELLTGVRPFPVIAAIRLDAIRVGVTPGPSMSRPLAAALVRAMALNPRDRWPSMRELIDALRVKSAPARPSRLPFVIGGAAVLAAAATVIAWQMAKKPDAPQPPRPPIVAPATPDAAQLTMTPPTVDAAALAPADAQLAAIKPAATKKPPPPTGSATAATSPQPPLRPLNNPKYGASRAYSSMMTWCRIPIDVKSPDPKLGKYGVVDWGPVTRTETVIASLGDQEHYQDMMEVRGARATYRFDAGGIGAGVFGTLDLPTGTLVALCVDPNRPEKSTIYDLPGHWSGGEDLLIAAFPIKAPPIVEQMKSLAPLHITDMDLRVSVDRGTLRMQPAAHYLVRAKVIAQDGALWQMEDWWLEVPKVKGADLVSAGKRLWFVIETPTFQSDKKLVAKAVMIFDEIFPQ